MQDLTPFLLAAIMVNQTGKKHVLYRKTEKLTRLSRDQRREQAIKAHHGHGDDLAAFQAKIQDAKEKHSLVKKVVREVVGEKAYEHRICEILRLGRDKPALRFAKARLGKLSAAKKKV